MEITNCEQYVLAELGYEQRRNERLQAENNRLAKRLDAMTKRAQSYYETIHREKTPIEKLADEMMREEMISRFTYASVTSAYPYGHVKGCDPIPFDDWCHEAFRTYDMPEDIDVDTIIDFMRDDLKAMYDEKVKEAEECTE